MIEQKNPAPVLPACLKCGQKSLGNKVIICQKCATELFGNSDQPIVFCKKCKRSRIMTPEEIKAAEKSAEVKLSLMGKKKIMLVLDSCPDCYVPGDSQEGQFAALTPMPEA